MNIGFLIYDRALVTGVSLSAEMFSSASCLRSRCEQRKNPLHIQLIAHSLTPIRATAGLHLYPDTTYNQNCDFDVLIFPPMWGNPLKPIRNNPQLKIWLQNQHKKGTQLIATGTGVVWLAETGLLDNQVATTHWYYYDQFEKRYPKVKLNQEATITSTDGIYCTSSINSQSEIVLYLIKKWFGKAIAQTIEKHYTHEISYKIEEPFYQIGGHLQFDESIALAQDLMKRNLSKPITSQFIANHCHLPLKTFNRKFLKQMGESPHKYLQRIRMESAKILLRDIGLSVQEVSRQVGYRDAHYFSSLFLKYFQLTPTEYRCIAKTKIYNS
ncbi:transcriptional regulator AraC family [Candidatus Photodesmus blepharus]|uniref:Transcriptional regulator AraC family n=1 Tax=Candidatus Photodesmus blepharonis TaxID=1179155 RepID=A0A084CND3_9GAMM|nr:helix-turn-helix domain-containing protein [Candidatus Photodesmus blepharus]KEY91312.1 transcriptional regulator AraC family [Candidatus Photodesmus blepharus]